MQIPNKPPFRPLTMAAVQAAPLSGLTHVSTFSGGGGTCLGFRLAGFRTLWANDLEEHARRSYAANLEAPIDGRDIRHLTAADILAATGLGVGELDVFEGSPPCTAFSTAGKRAKGWGQTKDHAGHVQANVEDLFFDWLRLLEGLRPRAFVAENVSGMVKGVAKGYFKDVLRAMKRLGYQSAAQVLDAQWLGVPQRRARVIFIGMREDLGIAPRFPTPWAFRYSVREALPWLTAAKFDTQGQYQGDPEFIDKPCPAIIGAGAQAARNSTHYLVQDGAFPKKWSDADGPSPAIMAGRVTNVQIVGNTNSAYSTKQTASPLAQPSPMLQAPTNQAASPEAIQVDPDAPSPVILARHSGYSDRAINRRRFTIAEVKRLCSFPDDYVLEGSYAQQWARLGNSVPPLMAYAIGEAVRDALLAVAPGNTGATAGEPTAARDGR